ncbi:hypothetical protein [Pseudomonas prosekii]|uniref:hypothetical protein n=1 Tax=Pseudomonas prosekii TaxID=1148509 RepID=UPI0016052F0A|nr:hypothetical protein [Pseudomonas prosekii]
MAVLASAMGAIFPRIKLRTFGADPIKEDVNVEIIIDRFTDNSFPHSYITILCG